MHIVTGGAGFIGSNIIEQLNYLGIEDILVVDNLYDGKKMHNISRKSIADYMSADKFLQVLRSGQMPSQVQTIWHMGACSSTTEWNGKYLMENNYEYSKEILHWSLNNGVQLIYASSASVYGLGHDGFSEDLCLEHPLNMYAYSKHLFDVYARKYMNDSQNSIVGLRFFNVYGPGEDHKNEMASTVYHFYNQLIDKQEISLFGGNAGYLGGEQSRDFVYVEDCALVCIWFHENQAHSGIYNVGSGISSSFNEVANRIITEVGYGEISYIPFPDHLIDAYQSYTLADLTKLRNVGCNINFRGIEQGVRDYINNYLSKK